MQDNGFLKEKCQQSSRIYEVYKCATSEQYYSKIMVKFGTDSVIISRNCSEDPRSYQSCGLVTNNKIINSDILCDEVICHSLADDLFYIYPLLAICYDLTRNIWFTPISCKPKNLDHISCLNTLYRDKEIINECDMICDCPTGIICKSSCVDEAVCNGMTYGLFCLYG